MKKRELLVFAGQSNMMGAAVYPPKNPILCKDSFEYKHKGRRLGGTGAFVAAAHPAGEFSYTDMKAAYADGMTSPDGKSLLADYARNTYFAPAMCNLGSEADKSLLSFADFSEASFQGGASLAPILAAEWEKRGGSSAYVHAAKGSVSIRHYFTDEMCEEYRVRMEAYNRSHGTEHATHVKPEMPGAAEYFFEKTADFFADAEKRFAGEELSSRILVWIQGESDGHLSAEEYRTLLEILWSRAKALGFTHFFMLRVGFWGNPDIRAVMRAQEDFCAENSDCYMMTRFLSYIVYPKGYPRELYVRVPDEYRNCRDGFYGFNNPHVNERGFTIAAERVADNMLRVLRENAPPVLEEELVIGI